MRACHPLLLRLEDSLQTEPENLANGEMDTNALGGGATAQSFTGGYSIGADNRGVMTLSLPGSTAKLAFAMLASGNAKFIEFDASGGAGTIGSGTIEKADTSAFNTARITGGLRVWSRRFRQRK